MMGLHSSFPLASWGPYLSFQAANSFLHWLLCGSFLWCLNKLPFPEVTKHENNIFAHKEHIWATVIISLCPACSLGWFWLGEGEIGVSVYEIPAGIRSLPLISSWASKELGVFLLFHFFSSGSILWEEEEWNKGAGCCQWSSGTEDRASAAEPPVSLNSFALAGLNQVWM